MRKTLLALGDLHVGNEGAIMPEDVMTDASNPDKRRRHFPSKIQRILLDKWYDMVDKYPRPDILLLNGDIIDGKNYKETGLGCWTTDTALQIEAVKQLVKTIKPRQIIGTSGSPYHSDRNPNNDRAAIEACGGTFKGGFANININGTRIHAMHKVSVSKSSWQYRCYSEDTEVFTDSGWKRHNEVLPGERIATYYPSTEKLLFKTPTDFFIKEYSGKMIQFTNKFGSDILVTPNHKMWVRDHNNNFRFRFAENLSNINRIDTLTIQPFLRYPEELNFDSVTLPNAEMEFNGHQPKNEETSINISDWAEFLGYYLSEGGRQQDPSNSNHQVTFAQKDQSYSDKMESCFNKIRLHFSKTNKDLNRWVFNRKQLWLALAEFGSKSDEKTIPDYVFKTFPTTALKRMFSALMLGDGSVDNRTNFTDVYHTTSLKLANDVQRLSTILGYPSRVAFHYAPKKPHHKTGYRVYLKSYPIASLTPKLVDYNGNVVCFSTESGLYLTRRPGAYPTIQGNTTPIARGMVLAALNESELGHYDISLRSHAHYFTYAGFSSSLGMILPCWKSFDSFGDTNIEHANPAIGYVVFEFEDDGSYTWHHDIMHFKGQTLQPDVMV